MGPRNLALLRDGQREHWILEDSIEVLQDAGGEWAQLAQKGRLQEAGAWTLDVCFTHVLVTSRIQSTKTQFVPVPNKTYGQMTSVRRPSRQYPPKIVEAAWAARRGNPGQDRERGWEEHVGNIFETSATILLLQKEFT